MSESRFDEFMDALFHCDTVKVILNGIGESAFGTEDIYTSIKHIIEQRDELLKNEKIRQEITRSLKEERNELLKKERLLLDKVQQLEEQLKKYSKATFCCECKWHSSWENENWDVVYYCRQYDTVVKVDGFCSMGEPLDLPEITTGEDD